MHNKFWTIQTHNRSNFGDASLCIYKFLKSLIKLFSVICLILILVHATGTRQIHESVFSIVITIISTLSSILGYFAFIRQNKQLYVGVKLDLIIF